MLTLTAIILWLEPQDAMGHHTPSGTPSGQSSLSSSFAAAEVQAYDLESTATLAVANFDNLALSNSFPANGVDVAGVGTFTSTATQILGDSYYRAGNSGRYLLVQDMTLTLADTSDYRYVGFYWSGGNANNHVQLLDSDNVVLAEFSADIPGSNEDVFGKTGACEGNDEDYCGSPNAAPNGDQDRFAFIHLRYEPGFRKIRFYGFNFEVDNVTVSQTLPGVSSSETDTQDFDPYSISTPTVIVADPRATSVSFPGVTLSDGVDETQAMLCFSQVAQGGAELGITPTLTSTGAGAGITTSTADELKAYSGDRDTIVSFSSSIDLSAISSGDLFGVGSLYIRVTATPQANIGTAGCTGSNTTSRVVEVRFLNILQSNAIGVLFD